MNYRYTIVTLGELLAVTRDGEQGFGACAEHAHSEELRQLFAARAAWCAMAAGELRKLIGTLGGDPGMHGMILIAARDAWLDLRAALSLNDDDVLLDQCERGDDHALEVYRNALDDHLPEFVRQVISRQFEDVMGSHDRIGALRNEPPGGGAFVASLGGYVQQ
jgi:uncharacterized protein (TIGR02284 family)